MALSLAAGVYHRTPSTPDVLLTLIFRHPFYGQGCTPNEWVSLLICKAFTPMASDLPRVALYDTGLQPPDFAFIFGWKSIWSQSCALPEDAHMEESMLMLLFLMRRFDKCSRNDLQPCTGKLARLRGRVMLRLLSAPLQSGVGFLSVPLPCPQQPSLRWAFPSRGGMKGLPCFVQVAPDEVLAPASPPTVVLPVCAGMVQSRAPMTVRHFG